MLGILFAQDGAGRIVGVVTDGAIRRRLLTGISIHEAAGACVNRKLVWALAAASSAIIGSFNESRGHRVSIADADRAAAPACRSNIQPRVSNRSAERGEVRAIHCARSRSLATTSMRGVVLESDRDIGIELSAASPADVEAFRALGTVIEKEHGAILDKRKELLQAKIAKARSRMKQIEKSSDQLVDRLLAKTDDRLDHSYRFIPLSRPGTSSRTVFNATRI
jgi:hypothetical protein